MKRPSGSAKLKLFLGAKGSESVNEKDLGLAQHTDRQQTQLRWPQKLNVLGVGVSVTTPEEALDAIIRAAKAGHSGCVAHLAVHSMAIARRDPAFRKMLEDFFLATPDGHSVRVALNLLYGTRLRRRVSGPDLMPRLVERAAQENIGIYLLGSRPEVVKILRRNLLAKSPRVRIVGSESCPFRPLTQAEDEAVTERINRSGAAIVFVGLGCPLQERFAWEHRNRIQTVMVCVGAAFDFIAGTVPRAPRWMQRAGLEWFFRLAKEPRRMWRRYLVAGAVFLSGLLLQLTGLKQFPREVG